MVAYLDSSVLLRIIFSEENPLKEFSTITEAVSSELLKVECFRVIDRAKLTGRLSEKSYVASASLLHSSFTKISLVQITSEVLQRASQSMPIALGTLDAIHLSSFLMFAEKSKKQPVMCTHDKTLADAVQSLGYPVLGV